MDNPSIQEMNDSIIRRDDSVEDTSEDSQSEVAAQGHKRKASEMDSSGNEEQCDASTASATKKRMTDDISNEVYLKPFDLGWKREVVNKKNPTNRKRAEVYYITPTGKKLRSKLQIEKYLGGTELTMDNFSLAQLPLGLNNSKKEIVREAKEIRSTSDKVKKLKPIVEITLTPLILIKKEKIKSKCCKEKCESAVEEKKVLPVVI